MSFFHFFSLVESLLFPIRFIWMDGFDLSQSGLFITKMFCLDSFTSDWYVPTGSAVLNFKSISKNFPIFQSFKILFQLGQNSVREVIRKKIMNGKEIWKKLKIILMPSLVRTCKWRVVGNEKLQNNPRRQYWRKVSGLYLRRGSALLQRSFFLIERRSHIPYNGFFLFSRSPTLMFPGYNVPNISKPWCLHVGSGFSS